MKLLLFSDLHADPSAARRLAHRARSVDVDVVVGAGDFGNVRRDIRVGLDVLKVIEKPTILVPGNNESTEELVDACRGWPSAHVLHGSGIAVAGVDFFGIGGGVPVTPFGDWSYDFTEGQAAAMLVRCPPEAVLVSHSPPKGAVDLDSLGRSLGSQAVRDAIARLCPRLVVCGHIHASAGQQARIGETPIVNAGPSGIVWDLDGRA